MTSDDERFLFDLRNALTPLKASVSLLAREWEALGEAERLDLAVLAHEQMRVVDEVLTRETLRHGDEEGPWPGGRGSPPTGADG